jgi:hypothetical protein
MHRRQAKPFKIIAQDGGDDDGGTLYILLDDTDRTIAAASWPQPLERIAHIVGHPVFRGTHGGGEPDIED